MTARDRTRSCIKTCVIILSEPRCVTLRVSLSGVRVKPRLVENPSDSWLPSYQGNRNGTSPAQDIESYRLGETQYLGVWPRGLWAEKIFQAGASLGSMPVISTETSHNLRASAGSCACAVRVASPGGPFISRHP